jgi:serine/threonine protein kinase
MYSLQDDLPRVAREVKALKLLNHQNIAQLFQIVETSEAFVLVLEYCRGGEVFDYIGKLCDVLSISVAGELSPLKYFTFLSCSE